MEVGKQTRGVRQPDVRAGVRSGAAIQVQLVFAVQELASPPRRHPRTIQGLRL